MPQAAFGELLILLVAQIGLIRTDELCCVIGPEIVLVATDPEAVACGRFSKCGDEGGLVCECFVSAAFCCSRIAADLRAFFLVGRS